MCADFNIHDTGSGNPHAHILLTMRPMDERGKWLPKSKKEYVLDENGERIRLPSGNFKTRKVDLVDWNSQENAEVWRKVWADLANEFLERNNRPERIDHRSYERQGIDQIPTVHIGVAASQMEKKGIATERGELNRSIKAANRLLRDIKAQNMRETQPIHDEYKQIRWKGKQEKFAEAHRADLAIWDAANRYLRANLPDMKLTPKA